MEVTADGKPSLTFLGDRGEVIQQVTPVLQK
jgi:hypothetical protein